MSKARNRNQHHTEYSVTPTAVLCQDLSHGHPLLSDKVARATEVHDNPSLPEITVKCVCCVINGKGTSINEATQFRSTPPKKTSNLQLQWRDTLPVYVRTLISTKAVFISRTCLTLASDHP